jgi:intracellular sulfur oxidation DsrE/DsrF family protein
MPEKTVFHLPEGEEAYGTRVFRNIANLLADETVDSTVADLVDGVELVSSAMTELTRKQTDGYAYTRP